MWHASSRMSTKMWYAEISQNDMIHMMHPMYSWIVMSLNDEFEPAIYWNCMARYMHVLCACSDPCQYHRIENTFKVRYWWMIVKRMCSMGVDSLEIWWWNTAAQLFVRRCIKLEAGRTCPNLYVDRNVYECTFADIGHVRIQWSV